MQQRSMCPATACLGSLMQNNATSKENRSKADILSQAIKFIEEYYMHQKK